MIAPGAPNPLLWGGGDPLDELGVIMNSVRFNPPDSPRFTRSPASTANTTKFTLFFSGKRSNFGTNRYFIFSDGSVWRFGVYFDQNDKLHVDANGSIYRQTTMVFRDPSAHINCMIAIDTSLAPSNNCIRIYIDDKEETVFDTLVNPSTGQAMSQWNNSSQAAYIGTDPNTGDYFGGMLSRLGQVAGQQLTPAATGSIHPKTGQWRPKTDAAIKALVDAGGTNSFFLNFADGSAATAAALGKDVSTHGNNFTPVNISVAAGIGCDWMLDTPTNSFCVLNPINAITSPATVSNGALDATTGSTGILTKPGTIPMAAGKWYWEVTPTGGSGWYIGVVPTGYSVDGQVGASGGGYSYAYNANKWAASVNTAYGAAYTTNDVIGVALDCDAGTITFYKNGVSQGQAFSGLAGSFLAIASDSSSVGSSSYAFNFGQRGFAYTPPTGFKALCTKNLSYPPISKSSSAFAAVTDSGANIAATLAAARAGWADYIEIFKRCDSAEGWRWRFSDDSANYLDSSSTAAKAAFPSLSGTSYVGYALKVSAANGIATGRLTHTNGTPSVVTDGLANSRKAIILKNEATGSWYFYHPDLTAGKLLYLEQNAAETTDATISGVTASGFTVAAALASGTYRWVALAQTSGFLTLGRYAMNGSAEGPLLSTDNSATLGLLKAISNASNWFDWDSARNPHNMAGNVIYMGATTAEGALTGYNVDLLSNAVKVRTGAGYGFNESSNSGVYLTIGQPFRYANAR